MTAIGSTPHVVSSASGPNRPIRPNSAAASAMLAESPTAHENWPARRRGSVGLLFPTAAAQLVVIEQHVSVSDAAGKLVAGIEMLVVSGVDGAMAGVLTKSDVLSHLALPQMRRSAHDVPVSMLMTRDVVRCSPADRLGAVWNMMHALDLRNVPITCAELKPLGILNARHALVAMLKEAEEEDLMLRDYVMGVGYR